MTSQTTISATSLFSALGLGLLVFVGACDTFDEGEEDEYLRSATVLDQLTGQQCRKIWWWAGYECFNSYDLTLNGDGTFVDSNAWEGTFEELDDDLIELDFGEKGITTLRATEQKNDKCWEPDPDAPVGGAGLINVCTVSQPFMRVKNYWSNSATTPYPWATLESFFWPSSMTRNYSIDLVGIPLGPPS